MEEPKFQIGDRIKKYTYVLDEDIRYGQIVKVYEGMKNHEGYFYWFYDIKFDNQDMISIGHLEHNLILVTQ